MSNGRVKHTTINTTPRKTDMSSKQTLLLLPTMCLKYFVEFALCNHGEYMGSHHCNGTTPCDILQQHFHYVQDNFPIPWPPDMPLDTQNERAALACTTCANKHRDNLDPDKQPVKYMAPTNNFQVTEISPPDCNTSLPLRVVKIKAAEDFQVETRVNGTEDVHKKTKQNEGSEDEYDYDYKALSDADDDEWSTPQSGTPVETQQVHNELATLDQRDCNQDQRDGCPSYLTQQRQPKPATENQTVHHSPTRLDQSDYIQSQPNKPHSYFAQHTQAAPFVPLGYWLGPFTSGSWLPYPMPPFMMQLAPLHGPMLPQWHGGMPLLFAASKGANTGPYNSSPQPMPSPVPGHAAIPTIPAVLPRPPAMPPSTALLPCPRQAPFIVGTMTDAYLRIQAARRRHLRERTQRARPSLRNSFPTRNMALAEFVVNKRNRRGQNISMNTLAEVETDSWSSLTSADEEWDAEGGMEEDAGAREIAQATCRFSCRLVTMM